LSVVREAGDKRPFEAGTLMRRKDFLVLLTTMVVAGGLLALGSGGGEPQRLGYQEQVETRLVQLDVTVSGPEEAIRGLEASDFQVRVGGVELAEFTVDDFCKPGGRPEFPGGLEGSARRSATYLFYFDQAHLTPQGRMRSLDVARELMGKLFRAGDRLTVVSAAGRVSVYADRVSSIEAGLEGLERLARDPEQWDPTVGQEEERVRELERMLQDPGDPNPLLRAVVRARQYYSEELWRTERAFQKFATVLSMIAEDPPPKVVVYFADRARKLAGEHYLRFFSESVVAKRFMPLGEESRSLPASMLRGTPLRHWGAQAYFDRVVREASGHGIRLYTVQGEGLVPSSRRIEDAQNTLVGFAAETGGRAFLHGVAASKMARWIEEDLSCVYLISFRPEGLREDERLPVSVVVRRSKVRVQVRGVVVVPSRGSRLVSKLLAAFVAPESSGDGSFGVEVIPTGYEKGGFVGLVQVGVLGGRGSSSWDLGASVMTRKGLEEVSGRLTVSGGSVPLILQKTVRFSRGPFEVVGVGRDVVGEEIRSVRREGSWPDLEREAAGVGPIAVVQRVEGAIQRDGEVSRVGSVAVPEGVPVIGDRAVMFATVVCAGEGGREVVRVERELEGEEVVGFEPIEMEASGEECAVVRDTVPGGVMGPGFYRYRIRLVRGGQELTRAERKFSVGGGGGGDSGGLPSAERRPN